MGGVPISREADIDVIANAYAKATGGKTEAEAIRNGMPAQEAFAKSEINITARH
jgi:hypothetical protein